MDQIVGMGIDIKNKQNLTKIGGATMEYFPSQTASLKFKLLNRLS